MRNAPNQNFTPLQARKYGKIRKRPTPWHHRADEGKSSIHIERVQALGAFRRLRWKPDILAERRRKTNFWNNDEDEEWIEDFVDRETAVAW